jgi:ferritin-like metal-binding protein YciE
MNEIRCCCSGWLRHTPRRRSSRPTLTTHIALTHKAAYKKRLQQHLKETRDHKRRVGPRMKQLGGSAKRGSGVPGVPSVLGEVTGKAAAAAKGQVGAVRAAVTDEQETYLRNAQEEFREEHVEIALYNRLEAFATAVGDSDTAKLAKSIRREEERMAKYLDAEIARLVKELVKARIPRDQRQGKSARRRSSRASAKRPVRRPLARQSVHEEVIWRTTLRRAAQLTAARALANLTASVRLAMS